MVKRITSLKPGQTINLKFHGSKRLGNDSYEDEAVFGVKNGDVTFEAYRFNGNWAYGTSAEKLSLA